MDRLLELLHARSFSKNKVILASGKESDFFIDCKQTALLAEGHALIGRAMFDILHQFPQWPKAVAGVELGGCSLASAVAFQSTLSNQPVDAIYVRKALKDHGSVKWLEGDSGLAHGDPVVVVEDVVTTGGSTIRAIERLQTRPLTVVGVIALVDRLEGARAAIESRGIPLISIYTRRNFIRD